MELQHILPVVIIAGVSYLIKIGALSAIFLALRKLWHRIRGKKN